MSKKAYYKVLPYKWQLEAIDMAKDKNEFALFADMGTGKTGALVNILRKRYAQNCRVLRTLVVSPLVTLYNWRDEIEKHSYINPSKVLVLNKQGSKAKAAQMEKMFERGDTDMVIIVNYEALLSSILFGMFRRWNPEVLVCDEAHYVKSHKAKRSKRVALLAEEAKYRYIMTGTPILNNVSDIFMQYRVLDGGRTFGENYFVFQQTYMRDGNAGWKNSTNYFPKWEARPEMFEQLQRKIYAKAIRVLKKDCLDLPPLIEKTVRIDLSKQQRKYYEEMRRDFVTFINEKEAKGVAVAQLAITKALRLQQIVTGFVSTDTGKELVIKENPRLVAVKDLLLSLHVEHKVIVWCAFRYNYKQLASVCEDSKIPHVFITGEMNLEAKREAMDKFNNDPECRVAIANRRAGGIGVNLVAADYSIGYSRNFNLGDELQSRDRNYRGGSEIHDSIVRLDLCATDTIDETIVEALKGKHDISKKIVDIIKLENNR